ncbi:MAG: heme oxygenase [Actinomycetota bacterium]
MSPVHTTIEDLPFSRLVRERSGAHHGSSESASFMTDLMAGRATLDDYTALVAQHWAIYEALEEGAAALREHPLVAPFLSDALTRLPALEADLTALLGESWRDRLALVPATLDYAARIREVATEWPAGFIAHHYTRYLGDLSGGLHIGRVVSRQFGFSAEEGDAGASFYRFEHIADLGAFKDAYRAQLDAAPWSADEAERVVGEVLSAYDRNTLVFEQLAARP